MANETKTKQLPISKYLYEINNWYELTYEAESEGEKYLKPTWVCEYFFKGRENGYSVVFPVVPIKELYSKTVPNKINCIKLVRLLTHLGLKEAKNLVHEDLEKTGGLQPLYNLAYLQLEYKKTVLDRYDEAYKASLRAVREAYNEQKLSNEGSVSKTDSHYRAEKECDEARVELAKAEQLIRAGEVISKLPKNTQLVINEYKNLLGGGAL